MLGLNRVVVGVLQKQALESRLSVLNYPARSSLDVDIRQTTAELARLRSQLRFFINVSGDNGQALADRVSKAFTANGLLIGSSPDEADALINGEVAIQPLSLNNPRAQFVRASATVTIIETGTGSVVATLQEDVRKGHVDPSEAIRKAVAALSETVAERLISEIGFGGDDATD
jgi:phage terminase large subunit-like protein